MSELARGEIRTARPRILFDQGPQAITAYLSFPVISRETRTARRAGARRAFSGNREAARAQHDPPAGQASRAKRLSAD
jgi:hypothetical protein